jgi:hypothetical protein
VKKTNSWEKLREQTDVFDSKLKTLMNTIKSAELSVENTIEDIYNKEIHDPRDREGDDGKEHMDEFDDTLFKKTSKTAIEVYSMQEMCNIFGLEKSIKAKVMTAYIGRYPTLRPVFPKPVQHKPSEPVVTPMSASFPRRELTNKPGKKGV